MFDIRRGGGGEVVMTGRFDASQERRASEVFDALQGPTVVDMAGLEYISSLGLGLLLRTEKRLRAATGAGLTLANMSQQVSLVFQMAGFLQIFKVDSGPT